MVPFQYTTYEVPREYDQEVHIATAREESGPGAMQQLVDEQVRQAQTQQNQDQVSELKSELEESGPLLGDEQDAIQVSVWQQGAASNSFVQGAESLAYMSYPQHQHQHQHQHQQQHQSQSEQHQHLSQQQHEHELTSAQAQNEYQQQYTNLAVQEPSSNHHLAQYQLNQHSPHLLQVHGRHHQQQQMNHHQLQHHQMPQTLAAYGQANGHGDSLGHNYSSNTSSAVALYNSYAVASEGKIGLHHHHHHHHHRTNYNQHSHSNHQQHLLVEQPACYLQQLEQQHPHQNQQHDLQQHHLTHQEASSKSAYQVNVWGQQQPLVSPLISIESPKDSLNSQQLATDHSAEIQVQSTLGEIPDSQVNQQSHNQQQSQAYLSLLSASSSSSTNLLLSTTTDSSPASSSGSLSSSSQASSTAAAKSGLLLDFYSNSVDENFKLTSLCANGKEQRNYQLQAGVHRALGGAGSQQQQLVSPTTKSCKLHISKEAQQNRRSNTKTKKTNQSNSNELSKRTRTTTDAHSSGGCASVSSTKGASYRKRLRDIEECATYKDADIEHTSTHIIVNNLTPDGKHIGEPVELTNQDLIKLTVRELNKKVQGFPKATILKLKARRRTLKNRGYAQNCRHKRLNQKHMLEAQNNHLHEELYEEKRKNEECRRIIEDLKLEILSLKGQLVQRIHH